MAMPRVNVKEILRILEDLYPEATCALHHRNPYELLVATILSAQCTDKRVNEMTPALFAKYPAPEDLAKADLSELERDIEACGLFRMKAKNLLATAGILVEKYQGQVPQTREALMELPGVGRKTANVVLSNAFGVPAIAVDTHVQRVSNRLGLAMSDNVSETEQQLMDRIPENLWSSAHHWLIYHGRQVCHARSPKCEICSLAEHCKHFKELVKTAKKQA